jgi:uncharacterized protein (TIGR03086 family)
MDSVQALDYSLRELRHVIASLDDSQMDVASNCEPWTVRQLASHAMNNQLVWAGLVTGQQLASFEDTMKAVPIAGALEPIADDVATRAMELWNRSGVLDSIHATPLGELPGSVVIYFAIIDAAAHAWDLSVSVGRPIEFESRAIPAISAVVTATCTDAAREHGLIKAATETPANATDTERLMAAAGRSIPR